MSKRVRLIALFSWLLMIIVLVALLFWPPYVEWVTVGWLRCTVLSIAAGIVSAVLTSIMLSGK